MALEVSNFSSAFGLSAQNSYHRIRSISGSADGGISYIIEIYYDKEARDSGKAPLSILSKVVPESLASRIGVIYELYGILKQESEYTSAVDVIDPGNFVTLSAEDVSGSYILSGALEDGYSLSGDTATDVMFTGKFVLAGNVVAGTVVGADMSDVVGTAGALTQGYITAGVCTGLIIQNLV